MANWTPGPWTIVVPPSGCDEIRADDGSSCLICELPYGSKGRVESANARLIAAAPELLEACEKMVEWDARENDHAIDFYARMELCRKAFNAVRAAIAKATQS